MGYSQAIRAGMSHDEKRPQMAEEVDLEKGAASRVKALSMMGAIEDALASVGDEHVVLTAVRNDRLGGVSVTAVSLRDHDFQDYLFGRLDADQASLAMRSLPSAIEAVVKAIMAETMAEQGSATCQITWKAKHGLDPVSRTPEVDDDLVSLSLSAMMDAFSRRVTAGSVSSLHRH